MSPLFSAKNAVVTGAASGVGRATALMLAGRGANVCCLDRDAQGLESVAAEIAGDALPLGCDLSSLVSIEDAVGRIREWRPRLDVLVHAAGVLQHSYADDVTPEDWQRVQDVNLRAPFFLTQGLLPELLAASGAVVAVASVAGIAGWPYGSVYSASKGGLVTMMRSLALEFGPRGIRVNVVCPGGVETPMLDSFRPLPYEDPASAKRGQGLGGGLAQPEEIAASICFLASAEASHISGTTLTVDGGASA